jgi:glutaredoxin-like protein
MSLLSATDQQTLRSTLADMKNPVKLLFFTQAIGCETCFEARQILDELTAASDQIAIQELNPVLDAEVAARYGIDRAPGLVLVSGEHDDDSRIRFLGAPAGYDFMALVDAILVVSRNDPEVLSDATRTRLAQLSEPITVSVFVTPTCGYCPRAVALANRLAFASPFITTTTIQATEFHDLARQYQVSGVPKTVVSTGREILGALPEAQFVAGILDGINEEHG